VEQKLREAVERVVVEVIIYELSEGRQLKSLFPCGVISGEGEKGFVVEWKIFLEI
jgi:hypothetical protein